jgi:hypothetical protein
MFSSLREEELPCYLVVYGGRWDLHLGEVEVFVSAAGSSRPTCSSVHQVSAQPVESCSVGGRSFTDWDLRG